jgi:hypothetical protein
MPFSVLNFVWERLQQERLQQEQQELQQQEQERLQQGLPLAPHL